MDYIEQNMNKTSRGAASGEWPDFRRGSARDPNVDGALGSLPEPRRDRRSALHAV